MDYVFDQRCGNCKEVDPNCMLCSAKIRSGIKRRKAHAGMAVLVTGSVCFNAMPEKYDYPTEESGSF